MTSFTSKHYPRTKNKLVITQEYSMPYYAAVNVIIMLYAVISIVSSGADLNLLWAVIVAELFAFFIGNQLGKSRLTRTYAEIFFVGEHFSLISVNEILDTPKNHAYPLRYANPVLDPSQDKITIHFNDQVVTLYKKDWEDFDLIVDWLYSRTL